MKDDRPGWPLFAVQFLGARVDRVDDDFDTGEVVEVCPPPVPCRLRVLLAVHLAFHHRDRRRGLGVGVLGVDGQVAVGGVAPVAGSGRSALLVGGLIEKNEGTGVLRLGVSALSGA